MASAVQRIKLSLSSDIPFNKLVLSQSNVRRVKAIEQLAESIAQRTVFSAAIAGAVFAKHGTTIETRLAAIDRLPAQDTTTFPSPLGVAPDVAMLLRWIREYVPARLPIATAVAAPSIKSPPLTAGPVRAYAMCPSGTAVPTVDPAAVELAYETVAWTPAEGGQITEALYEEYALQSIRIPGAQPHPTKLVQSAAMASVAPPISSYRPHLPPAIITKGLLSDAQLESVIYAGEAHSQLLAGSWTVDETYDLVSAARDDADNAVQFRRSWFLGDGTGAGKGRQVAGTLGRRRAVRISKSDKLIEDAQHDWSALGMERLLVTPLSRFRRGVPIRLEQGVLFTTYATLRSDARDEKISLVEQIAEWLGADFDGVIIFDESHAMQNAAGGKGERGDQAASQQGRAGVRLQHALPNARVVYVSATGATTVHNLAHAECLGLWGGEDFPFATRSEFVESIEAGDVAAMEVLARDCRIRLIRPIEHPTIPLAMMPQAHWQEVDRDAFARAWTAEVAEIPEFTDSDIHIVAGLLLAIWKRRPNESTRVYRPHTDTGERIIGRKVSPAWVLEAGTSRLSPDAAFAALMKGKTILELAQGLQVRRARVTGVNRIELTGFTDTMRDRLRTYSLFGEIISWKLRFFVPVDGTGPAILAKVPECYPVVRIADRAAA